MIDYIFTHLWLYILLCGLAAIGLMALVAALDDAGQAMVGETIKRRVERKTREGYYDK